MSADHNPDWPQRFAELAASSQDERLRAYYAAGCITADTPLAEAPLVALDVETTGLDPREHAIVSLGLVPLDLQRIRCAEARYWVVKPTSELSAESVTFHHITHSDIRHAPRLAHVLEELLEALAGKVVVVLACVAAPIVEEIMFRGLLYRYLREASLQRGLFSSALISALVSSFLFAVIHPQGLAAVPILMGLAGGFCLVREWRASLLSSMVAHGLNNYIALSMTRFILGG